MGRERIRLDEKSPNRLAQAGSEFDQLEQAASGFGSIRKGLGVGSDRLERASEWVRIDKKGPRSGFGSIRKGLGVGSDRLERASEWVRIDKKGPRSGFGSIRKGLGVGSDRLERVSSNRLERTWSEFESIGWARPRGARGVVLACTGRDWPPTLERPEQAVGGLPPTATG